MASDESRRDKDMVLAPNEYMFVLDLTKGYVDAYVGPAKSSLSNTDQPVIYDEAAKQFREVNYEQAKQLTKIAPEGWYVVLKNPAVDGKHPEGNGKQGTAKLNVGKKVNLPGPVALPLWPGQMAKVLKGHHLRSNQYLVGRVYDEAAARENWQKAVVKPASGEQGEQGSAAATGFSAGELTMGKQLIIKGTDVSFYIPPSGVEIIPDEDGEYVRDAVTLERLEYCLLMDENGNRRYERGPAVVFPEPTEAFVCEGDEEGGEEPVRKSRAIELNENSGIYIKVIADYEEDGKEYKVGDERFITGKEEKIYFPREEHAIVKYDKNEIHYGIAIPNGEARYVLDRNTGVIDLVKGPKVFLPDPREQVVVRRILDHKTCNLLFPNNQAAFQHNAVLAGVDLDVYLSDGDEVAVAAAAMMDSNMSMNYMAAGAQGPTGSFGATGAMGLTGPTRSAHGLRARSARSFSGASFDRKTKYTEPRTITLPTKFDGAVSVSIWTGYAVMFVRKDGRRRVELGPKTVLLEYDELPEIMELSTGKPKTTDNLFKTAYLRVKANKISDIVGAQTSDYCDVEMKLSYRMDFTGDPEHWFDVENYVKFMCDHLRSNLKEEIRKHPVEDFYANSTEIIRAAVLGDDRAGTFFRENGMQVYDVEVLGVSLKNQDIESTIVGSQKEAIKTSLAITAEKRKLEATIEQEEVRKQAEKVKAATQAELYEVEAELAKKKLELELLLIESKSRAQMESTARELEREKAASEVSAIVRERDVALAAARAEVEKSALQAKILWLQEEIKAVVARGEAISPELVSALQAFGDRALVEKLVQAVAPMSLLGGKTVTEIASKLFEGTGLAAALPAALSAAKNGSSPSSTAART